MIICDEDNHLRFREDGDVLTHREYKRKKRVSPEIGNESLNDYLKTALLCIP